jgi:hypothetical protein
MNPIQQQVIEHALARARALIDAGRLDAAFVHLERAHVLGQAQVLAHMRSHWLMLVLELRRQASLAAWGQLVRLMLGTLGSAIGIVPWGNTGGSNVGMFKRMPIAPELARIMQGAHPNLIDPD